MKVSATEHYADMLSGWAHYCFSMVNMKREGEIPYKLQEVESFEKVGLAVRKLYCELLSKHTIHEDGETEFSFKEMTEEEAVDYFRKNILPILIGNIDD